MSIKTDPFGHGLVRTFSDAGCTIIQDGTGAEYLDAVDPVDSGRTYTEGGPIEENPSNA